ncbi:MAG TPA: hypothetical protein VNJ04_08630, partial [Gemmatimonadaceae bacterium]|nr:hypothetical protein [Gemmatimonadaceae bacterium]
MWYRRSALDNAVLGVRRLWRTEEAADPCAALWAVRYGVAEKVRALRGVRRLRCGEEAIESSSALQYLRGSFECQAWIRQSAVAWRRGGRAGRPVREVWRRSATTA